MAKKLTSLLLSLCLLCGLLGACANQGSAETTKGTDEAMQSENKNHPGNDDTLSLLMVGNSFCYYYVEELYGLLMANPDPSRGYSKVQIFNLYYSGCNLDQHLTWWTNNQAMYQLFKTDETGRTEMEPSRQWTLENALKQGKWDYISLQGTVSRGNYTKDEPTVLGTFVGQTADPLLKRFHELHPDAQLLWHRTWPFEVGRIAGELVYSEDLLEKYNAGMQAVCDYVCNEFTKDKDYDLIMVNSGAAWPIARAENARLETSLIPYGGLCARLGVCNDKTFTGATFDQPNAGDGYHDGDIGGGQFLNACVWYETLTGQSCLDNPYKPTKENGRYELSDEFVALLRNAAHAVNQ